MRNFEDIRDAVVGHSIVRGVEKLPNGHARMETSFLYPDGGSIDVFVPAEDGPLLLAPKLTDFGQTTSWLSDVQVKPWLSKKRQRLLEDAIRGLGVRQEGGALELDLPDGSDIVDGVIRLGQACIRVAGLAYTRRTSLQASVIEEVEEILADAELDYEEGPELEGKYGAKVRVDFLVHGRRTNSALLTLSAANSSTAHTLSNEIFRRWYDLDAPTRTEQRVTLFDDRHDTYKAEDLKRLADVSEVVQLSDRKAVADLLAA
jgi:hypothetical protein